MTGVWGSWFFVLVIITPTEVGTLLAQLTQLYDLFPPSVVYWHLS